MTGNFLKRKFLIPILDLLRQGITPEKIALSIALGITLGVTPVLGSTSILCFLAAIAFRLNVPAIQLVNYAVYPLQFALLIPFIRLGTWMFGASPMDLTLQQIVSLVSTHPWTALQTLWLATLHALAAWLVIGFLASTIIYLLLTPILKKLSRTIPAGVR
ncbi:MAG: DUF2062 domain-containing protein [Terracidiphilus sp.]|jgi:uncharacterized protein (DUF2062 family)